MSEMLMNSNTWEPYVTKIFIPYAEKSQLVLDLGANLGYYTLIAAGVLGRKGKVVAFEPTNFNFNLIKKNVEANHLNNVVLEKKAVGDKNGKKFIYLNPENYGDNRMYVSGDVMKKETIWMTTLDQYFSDLKTSIDLIKMDIQGYELRALQGAKVLLGKKKIKVIISELWPRGMKMVGDKWEDYIKYLKLSGFKIYQVDEEHERLITFSEKIITNQFKKDKMYTTNILAVLK